MQFLGCFGWLLGDCYTVAGVFWGVTMQFLKCFGWLLGYCYTVAGYSEWLLCSF